MLDAHITDLEGEYTLTTENRDRLVAALTELKGGQVSADQLGLQPVVDRLEQDLRDQDERGDRLLAAIAALRGRPSRPSSPQPVVTSPAPPASGAPPNTTPAPSAPSTDAGGAARPTEALSGAEASILTALAAGPLSVREILLRAPHLPVVQIRAVLDALERRGKVRRTGATSGQRWVRL